MTLWFWQKGGLNWEVRWNYAASRAPYGPSVRGTIRVHQMHYLLSKSWLGAFSFHLTTCPPFPLCHKDSFLSFYQCRQAQPLPVRVEVGRPLRYLGTTGLSQGQHPSDLSKTKDRSAVPLGEGLTESLVQNSKVSKKCSFFKESWGCTKKGEAWPINIWAGFLGFWVPQAHWNCLQCKAGSYTLGSHSDGNILHLMGNTCLEDRKIFLLKHNNSGMTNGVWVGKKKITQPTFLLTLLESVLALGAALCSTILNVQTEDSHFQLL